MGWYDLPIIHKYRKQILCLDSMQLLTRGIPSGPFGLIELLYSGEETHSAYGKAGRGKPVIGQMRYRSGAQSARLIFLLPNDALDSMVLPSLLEYLAYAAGQCGAFHFLVEVEEHSTVFEALRRAGFAVYSRQRFWRCATKEDNNEKDGQNPSAPSANPGAGSEWKPARKADLIAMRNLYQSLVPSLVLPMEPPPDQRSRGLVYYRKNELLAYADIIPGPKGIWVQPIVHPAAEEVPDLMSGLLNNFPHAGHRPIYLCIRSYQGWLESILQDQQVEPGPQQALMVKHLAITRKAVEMVRHPVLENGRAAEHTSPVVNIGRKES
ncbi:MAG: hypothetical protein M1281_08815 [Chloroflexi bacterium]|nr:hypothetical protein [Chloroflexota bacterium]